MQFNKTDERDHVGFPVGSKETNRYGAGETVNVYETSLSNHIKNALSNKTEISLNAR